MMGQDIPYWRLSGFYALFFAALGVFVPYLAVYLRDLGFIGLEIGEIMAALMATRILSPLFWGWLADRRGRHMGVVQLTLFFSLLAFLPMLWLDDYVAVMVITLLFSFFWNAVLPQFDTVTLSYLGDRSHHYGRVRLWGSVGFILTVVILGGILDVVGSQIIPAVVCVFFLLNFLLAFTIREHSGCAAPEVPQVSQLSVWPVCFRREVWALMLVCFLMQAAHAPYYTFFTLYLEQYNYSTVMIGGLWGFGVFCEIALFVVMHRLIDTWGASLILTLSALVAALRWLLIGVGAENLSVLIFSQVLHAVTFGSFHAAAVALVYRYFKGELKGRGQALYSSVGFGAGGAVGSLMAGYLWEIDAVLMFVFGGGLAFMAWMVSKHWVKD